MPTEPRDTERVPEASSTEEDLSADWEALRGIPPYIEVPTFPHAPGDFILGTSTGRVILRITSKGRVQLGPGVDLDEAAELFWTNLALKRQGMEERLLHLGIMESILLQVAEADAGYERAQLAARTATATAHDHMMEEMARRTLETRVHGMLEFARGLRRRPDALESAGEAVEPEPVPVGSPPEQA